MPSAQVPVGDEVTHWRTQVAYHKAEIRRHRDLLRVAAKSLHAASLRRGALSESTQPPPGVEGASLHGRTDSEP